MPANASARNILTPAKNCHPDRSVVEDLRFFPNLVEGGWPLRVRGVLEHMLYLELGDARG